MQKPQRYLRHPQQIELRLLPLDSPPDYHSPLPLGLSLTSPAPWPEGTWLQVCAPCLSADLCAQAQVVECMRTRNGYELKLSFMTQEQLFRARMLEQLCQIMLYQRQTPEDEAEQRALEWISRQARHFPSDGL